MRSTDNQTQDSRQFGLAHPAVRDIRFQFQNLKCNEYNMTIETKYNIGDEVWWLWLGSCVIASGKVIGYRKAKDRIIYAAISAADGTVYIEVNRLFPTKEELLKSL